MRTSLRLVVTALIVVLWGLPAAAIQKQDKLDRALRQELEKGTPSKQRVIVSVKPGMRPLLRAALRKHGDTIVAEHPSLEALSAEVHGEDLEALANDPAIERVSIDATVTATARAALSTPSSRALRLYSGLRAQVGLQHSELAGRGIGVAVIDSGIANIADFSGRITAFRDFTRTGTPIDVPAYDDYGHGTHVAGLIGSSGAKSNSLYMGVAPEVRLIGLKVLDREGIGSTTNVINAITWVIGNRRLYGIHVINLSLGHPIFESATTDPLVRKVEEAVAAGLVVVVSAGNYGVNPETGAVGYAGITSPGNARAAITVGALKTNGTIERIDDKVADFSSRGPTWYDAFAKPDVVAPGDRLVSDCEATSHLASKYPGLKVSAKGNTCYMRLSGTSMSAAVTTGVVATMLEASRTANFFARAITPNTVKAVLQYSAIPVALSNGEPYDALSQGTGGVNAAGATAMASAIDTWMPVGAPWATPIEPVSVIGGQEYAWAQSVVWGSSIVWTTAAIWTNQIVWGSSVVWGSALGDDDNIVWGGAESDNIVWGSAAETWGDNIVWGSGLLRALSGDDNIVWGTIDDADNIVWGSLDNDNIVWGSLDNDNIVWGTSIFDDDNIVWGTRTAGDHGDNIVWGTRVRKAARK